jgi:hypothetical protein
MSSFDDTQWETKAAGAKLARINKECRLLAKRVKTPTQFPITPLPFTLARARARAKLRQQRVSRAKFVSSKPATRAYQLEESEAVDGCGRTRAASRIIGALKAMMGQPARVDGEGQGKIGLKQKRSQQQGPEADDHMAKKECLGFAPAKQSEDE